MWESFNIGVTKTFWLGTGSRAGFNTQVQGTGETTWTVTETAKHRKQILNFSTTNRNVFYWDFVL